MIYVAFKSKTASRFSNFLCLFVSHLLNMAHVEVKLTGHMQFDLVHVVEALKISKKFV